MLRSATYVSIYWIWAGIPSTYVYMCVCIQTCICISHVEVPNNRWSLYIPQLPMVKPEEDPPTFGSQTLNPFFLNFQHFNNPLSLLSGSPSCVGSDCRVGLELLGSRFRVKGGFGFREYGLYPAAGGLKCPK